MQDLTPPRAQDLTHLRALGVTATRAAKGRGVTRQARSDSGNEKPGAKIIVLGEAGVRLVIE